MAKKENAFVYLVPEDPYFTAIISQCITELSYRRPEYKHIILPIYGIKFNLSSFTHVRFIKYTLYYYFKQATLLSRIKKLIKSNLDSNANKKTYYFSFFDWLTLKDWIPAITHDFVDEMDFINHYELDGIKIGDLVCDTYLRFSPSPVFNCSDPFVLSLLHKAKRYTKMMSSVLKRYNVACVVGSYVTYIYHGIPHRVANSKGIVSIAFGCLQQFARVNVPHQLASQTAPYETYCFNGLHGYDNNLINLAKNTLENRISSSYDQTVPYMKRLRDLKEEKNQSLLGSIVIFLHDFFDSPHVYKWILFPDFYTWIVDTINFCIAHNIIIFIKPHPNQSNDSKRVVSALREKFQFNKCINWLDAQLSNSSIYIAKPLLVVTVYGSIAPEATYAGIRVLLAGDHPGINFPIGHVARSKADYFAAFLNPLSIATGDPEAAIAFIIQHNINIYQKEGQSLISYLGCSFNCLDANPEIIKTAASKKFIKHEVCKLLNDMEISGLLAPPGKIILENMFRIECSS